MLILFLDVDGVLNTTTYGWDKIDYHMNLLVKIIEATKTKIVLSSSWRVEPKDLEHIKLLLKKWNLEIYDCTPVFYPEETYLKYKTYVPRYKEIFAWIEENEVQNFAIIDDDPKAELEGHFFQIDERYGLTEEITEKVILHFKSS